MARWSRIPNVGRGVEIVLGNAGGLFGAADVQGNFGLAETFGPNPLSQDGSFEIHMFNSVSAFADPPFGYALLAQEVEGAFAFRNYSDSPTDVTLAWHAEYQLLTDGTYSNAGIMFTSHQVKASGGATDSTLFMDSAQDGVDKHVRQPPAGTSDLVISLDAATMGPNGKIIPAETDVDLTALNRAEAEASPEPATLIAGALGALIAFGLARRR